MPAAASQVMAEEAGLVDVLREGPGGAAVFVVHAMGGQTGCYQALADRLAFGVYGLRAPKPGEALYPLRSVEEMAQTYLRAIETVPRFQTLHLVGWSMGGLIAFEMARRLDEAGAGRLGALVLVDTWLRPEQLSVSPSAAHRAVLDRRKWRVFAKLAVGSIGALEDDAHPFWALDDAARRRFILALAQHENTERYGRGVDADARLDEDYAHYMVLRGASDSYRPGPYPGRIAWIAAEGERDLESPEVWAQLAQGGCDVAGVPGRHLEIIHPPWVDALAEAVGAAISSAGVPARRAAEAAQG